MAHREGYTVKVTILPRRMGKTSALVDWAENGVPLIHYPFWNRIILTPNMGQAEYIRKQILYPRHKPTTRLHLDGTPCVHDVYRWVFSWEEWTGASIGRSGEEIEIAIDNVDTLLIMMLRGKGSIKRITINRED